MSAKIKTIFLMKKLLIASIVMLATLTACNNSESVITPEEQQHQTFSGKTTAREGGYTDEEIKYMQEAMIDLNADYLGNPNSNSRVKILCHTDYTLSVGNACVQVDNYLFNVTWQDAPTLEVGYTGPNAYSYWPRNYQANLVSSCSCK